jgi:hypothetical protein
MTREGTITMNRRQIGRLFATLVATLGLAGASPFVLGGLPPVNER